MQYSKELAKLQKALQPVLLAPKQARRDENWRVAEYERKVRAGEYKHKEFELERALKNSDTDEYALFHVMQLMAYMLSGSICAAEHASDMGMNLAASIVQYCAAMNLCEEDAQSLVSAASAFLAEAERLLSPYFEARKPTEQDAEILKVNGLWER